MEFTYEMEIMAIFVTAQWDREIRGMENITLGTLIRREIK